MTIKRTLLAAATSAVLIVSVAACSSPDDPAANPQSSSASGEKTASPPSTADESKDGPKPAPAPSSKDEGKVDKTINYTDPSKASDYCGVFKDFEKFNDEGKSQTSEKSTEQYEDRLKILVGMMHRLEELAPNDTAKKNYADAAKKYDEAYDFYVSSGKQVINDDVLVELAKALEAANTALEGEKDSVKKDCNIDLSPYITNGK